MFKILLAVSLSALAASEASAEISSRWLPAPFDGLPVAPNGCPVDWSVHLLLPHEEDCTKFYQCSNGVRFLMDCAPGTAFDYPIQVCNWPNVVHCIHIPSAVNEDDDGSDDNTEQLATTWKPNEQDSSTPTSEDGNDDINDSVTAVPINPIKPTPKPPKPEQGSPPNKPSHPVAELPSVIERCKNCTLTTEYYPYACDCRYFFRCHKGLAVLDVCPVGLLFNAAKSICDFPKHTNCRDGSFDGVNESDEDDVPVEEGGEEEESVDEDATPENHLPVEEEESQNEIGEDDNVSSTPEAEHDNVSSTPEGEHDNVNSTPEEVDSVAEVICPPGYFGNVPHPTDCDSFYFCAGGVEIQLYCNVGQEYDVETGNCVQIRGDGTCSSRHQ